MKSELVIMSYHFIIHESNTWSTKMVGMDNSKEDIDE
jgi:hypothetical protein